MKLKCHVGEAITLSVLIFAIAAPGARAAAVLPGIQADVNLFGSAGDGPFVFKEYYLNFNSGDFYALPAKSLPLLATVAGHGGSDVTGASVSGAASAGDVTEPAVLVSGAISGGIGQNGHSFGSVLLASASLKYAFEIVGPGTSSIPVLFQGNNSASQSISTSTSTITTNYDVSLSLAPNAIYYVDLGAGFQVQTQGTVLVSADADPTLTVDPSFADAGDYSIAYSPDLAQTATPKPASIPLVAAGLVLLAVFRFATLARPTCPSCRRT